MRAPYVIGLVALAVVSACGKKAPETPGGADDPGARARNRRVEVEIEIENRR